MSMQVGASCYASSVDAGRAACASFDPVTTITASSVRTVTCASSDGVTGALNLSVSDTDIATNTTTITAISQLPAFPDCVQSDYVDAIGIIFAGLLSIWCIWICAWKLLSFLGWSRGENV